MTTQLRYRRAVYLYLSHQRTNAVFLNRGATQSLTGMTAGTCKYGEFGIDTDTPTEEGYCKYQIVKMNRFTVL
jgi:hypothetical protein